jgi:erythromycin esterase-like protein
VTSAITRACPHACRASPTQRTLPANRSGNVTASSPTRLLQLREVLFDRADDSRITGIGEKSKHGVDRLPHDLTAHNQSIATHAARRATATNRRGVPRSRPI